MQLANLTDLDKKIFKYLNSRGMTVEEAIQIIICEIYYLTYKDKEKINRAITFLGNNKEKTITENVYAEKRKKYFLELERKKSKSNSTVNDYLFAL
ncbi:hypothetical protein GNP82_01035 [Aliivibrio fischeri]|uniref:hypothetical protein n=1 Tax=Aliivibrio fischeri TaxID=668 RepID=UPI0012D89A04|nr:hypothetical protein [Aliivibrio fischeri]MUK36165.1 hypothetical protein [Aliivibrio fischeri]MUL00612.1 hypothetical protein [Aliivibrio fischeri]MUL06676.1 hypothetical protein [Aliivibrio fischeri]